MPSLGLCPVSMLGNVSVPKLLSLGCPPFYPDLCGSHSREGKRVSQKRHWWQQPPAARTTQTHVTPSFPDLLGWWQQPGMEGKLLGVPNSSMTHTPTHWCAALSQLSGSKEPLPAPLLTGILLCLPPSRCHLCCLRQAATPTLLQG